MSPSNRATHFDGRSHSLWMDVDVAPEAEPLGGDISCDTVVVGAGMAATALEVPASGVLTERSWRCPSKPGDPEIRAEKFDCRSKRSKPFARVVE